MSLSHFIPMSCWQNIQIHKRNNFFLARQEKFHRQKQHKERGINPKKSQKVFELSDNNVVKSCFMSLMWNMYKHL